jgi:hypothetical protein
MIPAPRFSPFVALPITAVACLLIETVAASAESNNELAQQLTIRSPILP